MSINIYLLLALQTCTFSQSCLMLGFSSCVDSYNCIKKGNVIFRDRCLPLCPEWVDYYNNDTHTCYTECPKDSVVNRNSCLSPTTCTNKNQVVFNRSCVDACPVQSRQTKDGVCYSTCPTYTVINGSMCIEADKCTEIGHYVFNGTCVKSCPNQTSYIKYGTCLYTCSSDTVRNGNSSCITEDDCHKLYKVTYNGDCLESCPSKVSFNASGICSTNCPKHSVKNGRNCIERWDCTYKENKFVFGDKCVSACPDEASYHLFIDDIDQHKCLSTCQPYYVSYELKCIPTSFCTSIMLNRVMYNGSCVRNCPNDAPFMHEKTCYSKCPEDLVANGPECISTSSCTSIERHNGMIYKGSCVTNCPIDAPFMHDKICYSKCPKQLVANGPECISMSSCTSIERHNGMIYKGSCVTNCPIDAPFMHDKRCYSKCPKQLVANGSECISMSSCTSIDNRVIYNVSCVKKCPAGARFLHEKKCYSKCPDDLVANVQNCVTKHECVYVNGKFLLDGTCVESCPHDIRFTKDGECYEHCPHGSVSENSQCIENQKCRFKNKIIFNGACIKKCPSESPYENGGKCLVKCPGQRFGESGYMLANNGTKCIGSMTCTRDYDHYVYDQVCVPKCPIGTGVWLGERPPWDRVCYSLEKTKIFSVLSSASSVLCVLVLVSMVYNPKASNNEEERGQQFKQNEDSLRALDTHVVEDEGRTGHLRENNTEEDEGEAEPDNPRQPEVVAADGRNVIVHNDRSRFGKEVPLLTMANKGARNLNGDEDDDTLSTSL